MMETVDLGRVLGWVQGGVVGGGPLRRRLRRRMGYRDTSARFRSLFFPKTFSFMAILVRRTLSRRWWEYRMEYKI